MTETLAWILALMFCAGMASYFSLWMRICSQDSDQMRALMELETRLIAVEECVFDDHGETPDRSIDAFPSTRVDEIEDMT